MVPKRLNFSAVLSGEPDRTEHRFAAKPVRPAGPVQFLKTLYEKDISQTVPVKIFIIRTLNTKNHIKSMIY